MAAAALNGPYAARAPRRALAERSAAGRHLLARCRALASHPPHPPPQHSNATFYIADTQRCTLLS
jgi:hypothetical protein